MRFRPALLTVLCALWLALPSGARHIERQPANAQTLLREAASATTRAGTLHYALHMRTTTTNISGGSWTSESTLNGNYAKPDRLQGVLTIANPWATIQSRVIVAGGEAYVTDPQTGAWETGLKRATSYYPVVFTGCLIRMAEADMDSLILIGLETLGGESVYHLKGPGGARDELEIEYWLGIDDGLPRQAIVRTQARPGWSDESHMIQITARLRLSRYGKLAVIEPPTETAAGAGY
jgi:hypothetical protein